MKLKNSFFYTLRENVKDEDSISGNLLSRAGMIKKNSAGVYMYLPLGYKVMKNIERIIREEMDAIGAQELLMPALIPEETYVKSGRRDIIGDSMFSLKDRANKPYVLGPTHEELFAMAANMKIKSYKDMPFNIYQFQTKFRDEKRPRFGLIRVKEFIMKDAYSFDKDLEGLDVSYQKVFNAYKRSFDRMGIEYRIVTADTGIMGGLLSEEFQAITDVGEDIVVLCDHCDYASNLEVSECVTDNTVSDEPLLPLEKIHTPHVKTIEELVNSLSLPATKFVKTLIYKVDDNFVACLVKGDREVNETKVRKLLNANDIELADAQHTMELTHANVGFAGPIGLDIPVIMDHDILTMKNFIVGANETDYHLINVNITDFKADYTADIKQIKDGDTCPKCGHTVHFKHGIEIGNTFKLGTKYASKMGLSYLDQNNQLQDVVMGSYGIGIGRCLAALVEQNHSENAINLPMNIAPYQVAIVIVSTKDEQQVQIANQLYEALRQQHVDVILDDRDERVGVKFKDMELIGIPIRITVGKHIATNQVELKLHQQDNELVLIDDVCDKAVQLIKDEWK